MQEDLQGFPHRHVHPLRKVPVISVHLVTKENGEPMVKLIESNGNFTKTWIVTPDDAAFLFFDLDEVLKQIRQRMPAPQ